MIKNYIKITFKNLYRRLGYTFINVFGLAVGISCCLLISIYVIDELSYDKFHDDAENIFRINVKYSLGGVESSSYVTPTALLPNVLREFSQVKSGVRLFDVSMFSPKIVSNGINTYQEDKFFYADSTFFNVFSFELLAGNPQTALVQPASIILTEEMASKYIDHDPLGETLIVGGIEYKVTGILKKIPSNSHLKIDFLASFSSLSASNSESWWSANYATFISFHSSVDVKKVGQEIETMVMKKMGSDILKNDDRISFELMPLTDIHLKSNIPVEMQPQSDIKYIYIISFIGLLILIVACVNYMNLATARAMDRAKEVGIRKVLGAIKKQLVFQFIGESIIVTLLSAIVALIMFNIFLPAFNSLTGKSLTIFDILSLEIIIGNALIIILVSLLAGAYPAMSLASFQPSKVLKGSFKGSASGNTLRKFLVVFQFSISIILIIGTLVIYQQLNFMRNKKLGYNKDNVIVIPTDEYVNAKFNSLKTVLEQRSEVVGVSIGSESPTEINGGYGLTIEGTDVSNTSVNAVTVDNDYISVMGMEIMDGRSLNESDYNLATNANEDEKIFQFIVNEALLNQFLITADKVLGKKAILSGRNGEIIGVVKNFHFSSLHQKINPLVMFIEPSQYNKLFVRIKSEATSETLSNIENIWKEIIPERPFAYTFMDDDYNAQYLNEERLGAIFVVFASLAIIIGCLGLFGLVSFTVQQRNMEIGVRKVLGASVFSVFFLISKDFTKSILAAFIVSCPLAYYLMTYWLESFEYRMDLGITPFIFSIIITIIVTLVTVSYQSIGAALSNPVETLKSE